MKRKTERVEFRMTPETKGDWLWLCELLPGNTQSEVFRFLIDKITNETYAAIHSGEFIINND